MVSNYVYTLFRITLLKLITITRSEPGVVIKWEIIGDVFTLTEVLRTYCIEVFDETAY